MSTSEDRTLPLLGRRGLVIGVETAAGGALATALGEAGADLGLATMRADEGVLAARRLQRRLRGAGREANVYAFDVTLGQNVKVSTRQVTKELGGLDFVVSAPDEPLTSPLERLTDSDLARVTTVNFYAHVFAIRAAVDEFRRPGQGHVLLVVPETAAAEAAAYRAAQAATLNLVTSLSEELRPRSVAVNAAVVPPTAGSAGLDRAGPLVVEILSAHPADVTGRVYHLGHSRPGADDQGRA
ncbi:MAG: SDR family NAD(P)-dependent oxidoreductase [Dehalococcoidia bacterium]